MPTITHWQHPNWFAYFPANTTYPSILGELLSAGLGVQGMSWVTSPACTELETLMLDWMQELLALPGGFRSDSTTGGGVINVASASASENGSPPCSSMARNNRAGRRTQSKGDMRTSG